MATCKECFHWNACQCAIKMCNCKVAEASEGAEECENYLPIADVAEVVRCKDCVKSFERKDKSNLNICFCDKWKNIMRAYDYCSFGERKRCSNDNNTI